MKSSVICPCDLPGTLPSNVVHPWLSPIGSPDAPPSARAVSGCFSARLSCFSPGARRSSFSSRILCRTRYCRPQRVSQRTVGPRPAPSPDPGSDAAAVLWYRARSSGRGGADQRDSRPRARPAVSRRSIFPKGTPYSAHDPALLAWVHATLLEMNLRAYELFVGPLTLPSRPTSDRRKRGQFRGSYHGSTGSSLIRCDREQSPAAPALKGRLPGCALAHANRDINEIFRKVTPNFRRL